MSEAKTAEKKSEGKFKKFRNGLGKWFRGYISEFKKIVWPTRKQVIRNTIITIVMVLVVGAFIWLVDWGLLTLLDFLLSL